MSDYMWSAGYREGKAEGFRLSDEKIKALEDKLESAEQLLKQLNTDLNCMEHTYIGKGSVFHRKVEEWLRQSERGE
jgi:hypothetical protein